MALPASDAFTDSDGVSLPSHNAGWTAQDNGCQIHSNGAQSITGVAYSFNYWSGDTFNSDHLSFCTMLGVFTGGPCVRMAGTNNCYMYDIDDAGTTYLFKRVGGSYTNISPGGLTLYIGGEIAKIIANGTTLQVFKNGAQEGSDVTDSSLSGGAAGVMCFNGGVVTVLDDWQGDNLTAAVPLFTTLGARHLRVRRA